MERREKNGGEERKQEGKRLHTPNLLNVDAFVKIGAYFGLASELRDLNLEFFVSMS